MDTKVTSVFSKNTWQSHDSRVNQVTWLQTGQFGVWFLAGVLEIFSTLQLSTKSLIYSWRHQVAGTLDGNAYQWSSKILKIDGQSSFHWATPCHNTLALQHPLHHTECIMNRPFHLITVKIIRPTQNDWAGCASLWAVETRHTHFNSPRSNFFCMVRKTAGILQMSCVKEEASLWARNVSPAAFIMYICHVQVIGL